MRKGFVAFIAAILVLGATGVGHAAPADQIVIDTSMGDITIALDRAHAPMTVDNFLRYVNEGHFDGTLVYRVVPGFVIQAGSYDSATHQRPVYGPIPLEANNGLSNVRGTIAMARENDPNTATAEFFINLADNLRLDHHADDPGNATGYTVFGRVVSGMDVVDKIASVPLGDGGPMAGAWPLEPATIRKVRLLATPAALPPAAASPAPSL
ncbi:MAG TPA: peptidylprolyl isomerase [Rhizomicrobium sp.]|jgi:cyclophilin family peptidyl-prolyl cis-trans isomerase|nr:peptidylprolyl isomerase [Rhizomicrobium sp.]